MRKEAEAAKKEAEAAKKEAEAAANKEALKQAKIAAEKKVA